MTYKRYLLSVLLLGMTANVFCDGLEVTIEQVEKATEEQVEGVTEERKLAIIMWQLEMVRAERMQAEGFYRLIKQGEQFINNNFTDSKIKEEADQWNKEIREREHYFSFEKYMEKVSDIVSKKVDRVIKIMKEREQYSSFGKYMEKVSAGALDPISKDAIDRKVLRSIAEVLEILPRKFRKCLDNPENSIDHCIDSAMFALVLFDRDERIVDSIFKGLFQPTIDLRERVLEEESMRLGKLKRHIQGKQQSKQEEVLQQEE